MRLPQTRCTSTKSRVKAIEHNPSHVLNKKFSIKLEGEKTHENYLFCWNKLQRFIQGVSETARRTSIAITLYPSLKNFQSTTFRNFSEPNADS